MCLILELETSLVVQWLRLRLPMQGVQGQSLVGELKISHVLGSKDQNIKQNQYCHRFIKTFKMVHLQEKKKGKSVVASFFLLILMIYSVVSSFPAKSCSKKVFPSLLLHLLCGTASLEAILLH